MVAYLKSEFSLVALTGLEYSSTFHYAQRRLPRSLASTLITRDVPGKIVANGARLTGEKPHSRRTNGTQDREADHMLPSQPQLNGHRIGSSRRGDNRKAEAK